MDPNELRKAIAKAESVEWEIADEPVEAGLGYVPSEGVPPVEEQVNIASAMLAAPPPGGPSHPDAVDLRATSAGNMITPIRNQANCGSCVAFGTCATVEGTLRCERRDPNLQLDLAEAYLFYCRAVDEGCNCKTGWNPAAALEVFKSKGGAPDEASFPYTAGDQACAVASDWESRATTIADWVKLNTPDETKAWIAEKGPAVAAMAVYEDFRHYMGGGVYKYVAGPLKGGHCICLVGYDDSEECWIGKNSWGTGWGEDGFFRIGYGECGIDSGMLGVEGVKSPA